jgi:hypothetical protein
MNNPISYKCPICEKYPKSHSFRFIGEYKSNLIMYTCPEEAVRYNDHDGIITHYKGVLENIKEKNRKDCENHNLKIYLLNL